LIDAFIARRRAPLSHSAAGVSRRLAGLVETLVEAEQSYPVAAVWNDRLGSALVQFLA
jgi:hypothetical protein